MNNCKIIKLPVAKKEPTVTDYEFFRQLYIFMYRIGVANNADEFVAYNQANQPLIKNLMQSLGIK